MISAEAAHTGSEDATCSHILIKILFSVSFCCHRRKCLWNTWYTLYRLDYYNKWHVRTRYYLKRKINKFFSVSYSITNWEGLTKKLRKITWGKKRSSKILSVFIFYLHFKNQTKILLFFVNSKNLFGKFYATENTRNVWWERGVVSSKYHDVPPSLWSISALGRVQKFLKNYVINERPLTKQNLISTVSSPFYHLIIHRYI